MENIREEFQEENSKLITEVNTKKNGHVIKQRKDYIEKIRPFINKPIIKVLTGIRRSGKSTIMLMIIEELKKIGIAETQIFHTKFNNLEYEGMAAKRIVKTAKVKTCKRYKNIFIT